MEGLNDKRDLGRLPVDGRKAKFFGNGDTDVAAPPVVVMSKEVGRKKAEPSMVGSNKLVT